MRANKRNNSIGSWVRLAVLTVFALFLGLAASTPAHATAQDEPVITAINEDVTIEQDETIEGDVSVTGGDLLVLGKVMGKVVVVSGKAQIEGEVTGDVFVTQGDVYLKDGSIVGGNVVAALGEIFKEDRAQVGGTTNNVTMPGMGIGNTLPFGPPHVQDPEHSWGGSRFEGFGGMERMFLLMALGMFSMVVLALGAGIAALFPSRVKVASATLDGQPGPSLVVGGILAMLLMPVAGLLTFILTITVVGIVLVPVLAVVVAVGLLIGLVVASRWLGRRFFTSELDAGPADTPQLVLQTLLGMSVLLGSTVLPPAFLAPWVAFPMVLLLFFVACVGLGSLLLSRLGTLPPVRRDRPSGGQYAYAAASGQGGSPAVTSPLGPPPGNGDFTEPPR